MRYSLGVITLRPKASKTSTVQPSEVQPAAVHPVPTPSVQDKPVERQKWSRLKAEPAQEEPKPPTQEETLALPTPEAADTTKSTV